MSNALVLYFSATGQTQRVAKKLASVIKSEICEIQPQEPYSANDLNWHDRHSRSSLEINDPRSRPVVKDLPLDLEAIDLIFLGYPIWWGEAPRAVNTVLESLDLKGKTIIPFCTSGGSGLGQSDQHLALLTKQAKWKQGRNFSSNVSEQTLMKWAQSHLLTL